jgi:Zn-dependent protease
MSLQSSEIVDKVFQYIAFLFAISVHESAHAWMANRCGDPTARMLGRITLNPVPHIDVLGTVVLPLVGLFGGGVFFGWAKPTPVDPRNFSEPVRDDVLTTVAGPVSNFVLAAVAVVMLIGIALSSPVGHSLVIEELQRGIRSEQGSFLAPTTQFLYDALFINVILGVFNLIPIPPLDGSHVLRHLLPDSIRGVYDRMGMYALIALFVFGGPLIGRLIAPVWRFFNQILIASI